METKSTTTGSILIAHLGDTHLRDTQYATSQRGVDFFEAFKRAIEAIAEHNTKEKIDLIVCAGDIFDMSRPSAKVIGQLIQIDKMLERFNLPMLCVTGNHDHSKPTWLATLFPGPARASGITPIDGRTYEAGGFTVAGVPPYTANAFRSHRAEIEMAARDADVLVYHGFVTGIVPIYTGDKNVLAVDEIPLAPKLKAVLLGDIHVQGYVERDNTLIGYPGSLEMCSAGESTEKSIPLIRVDADGARVAGNLPLRIRPFVARKVLNQADLDNLIADVTLVADQHPVVPVEFDRSMPETVTRLHAVLDAQRAVIR
jgi:exonuclease SbcD